jgi:hypothetical protein
MTTDKHTQNQLTLDLHDAITDNGGVECSKVPAIFFPEDLVAKNDFKMKNDLESTAREICFRCPVIAKCLKVGLYEPYGIWGGTTPAQREKIKREIEI